jgi:hypothetical protein
VDKPKTTIPQFNEFHTLEEGIEWAAIRAGAGALAKKFASSTARVGARAARATARGAVRFGKSAVRKTASAFSREATKETIKSVGANLGAGVAIEAGAEAWDKKKLHDARKKREHELDNAGAFNESSLLNVQPPVVLILKRKSIRLFPQGEKVALYKNDRLGLSFAVPYDDLDDGKSSDDKSELSGAIFASEDWKQSIRKTLYRFKKRPGNIDDIEKALRRTPAIEFRSPWRAIATSVAASIGAGYATDKVIDMTRKKYEKPNKKRHGGSYVYEDGKFSGVMPGRYVKLGLAGGLAFGASRIAYDVAKDVVAGEKSNKKKKKKKLVVQEARIVRPRKEKVIWSYLPRGYKRAFAKKQIGRGLGAISRSGIIPGIALGAGIGSLTALATQKYHDSQQRHRRMKSEEVEKLDEILPLVAGVAARAVIAGTAARALATRAVTSNLAKTAAVHTAIGVGSSLATDKVMNNSASKKKPVPKTTSDVESNDEDETNEELVGEATSNKSQHVATKLKRRWVPQGLGREVVKGSAIALGSAIATKLIDTAYDKYRDKQEIKKARAEARAKAQVEPPQKVITQRKVNPKTGVTVTTTKKMVKESIGYEDILHVKKNGYGYVKHMDGNKTKVDHQTASAIVNIHEALKPVNQEKLRDLIARDRDGLTKVANFAFKQDDNKGK